MSLILYGCEISAPVRAVLLTLRALELQYEFREVDLSAKEQLQSEFVKKNPQHTVPVLEDGDACIWDSHAICAYLVNKYGKDDSLYPKDPLQRASVDQRLHFDSGVVFIHFRELQRLVFEEHVTELPKDRLEQLHEAYALLELLLAEQQYLAGSQLTIADFSIVATLSTLQLTYAPLEATRYPRLSAWLARISSLPYYEQVNLPGARQLAERVRAKLPTKFDKLWQKAFADIRSGAKKQ